jgi:putative component of membrane protein insertase Oxa1/YidC/SpoIIIJ protein YidD
LIGAAIYSDVDVGRSSFTKSVLPTRLAQTCGLGNDAYGNHCTHGITWSGDVTFTRVSSCTPAAGGGYLCRPL